MNKLLTMFALACSTTAMAGGLFDSTHTPYETMSTFFNQASPLGLNEVPKITDPDFKKWACYVVIYSSNLQTIEKGKIPALLNGVATLSAAVPDRGPLFPAVPAETKSVQIIRWLQRMDEAKPDSVGAYWLEHQVQLSTSPELSEHLLNDTTHETTVYRKKDGLIVVKSTIDEFADRNDHTAYVYCYKK